jgi:hypothetical protein
VPFDARPLLGDREGWCGTALRISGPQTSAPAREGSTIAGRAAGPLPRWAVTPPLPEPDPPRPLLPSRPSGPEPATLSPPRLPAATASSAASWSTSAAEPAGTAHRVHAKRRHGISALPVHGLASEERPSLPRNLAVLADPIANCSAEARRKCRWSG